MGEIEGYETDDAGAPVIKRVSAKIGALERRAEHLEEQLSAWTRSRGGKHFAEGELKAIKAGIAALRYHRADIEGMDTPILALQQLVDAAGDEAACADWPEVKRARAVLLEWAS